MKPQNKQAQLRSFLIGGILPIVAFTFIEDHYGVVAGLIAAMIFGVGELSYEYIRFKKIERITLIGNALVIGLGLLSLWSTDGIWFKLQPALLCLIFAGALIVSSFLKKPLLVGLARAQNAEIPELALVFMSSLNWRLGIFFIFQAALGTWAALHWSTTQWALLKGIGLPVMMFLYMIVEVLIFRLGLKK